MGWQTVVAAIFQAGNRTVINAQGLFVYNGPPALGNLIASIAPAAGVDPKGNSFPQGLSVKIGSISGSTIIGGLIETSATNPSVQLDGARNALFVYDASNNLLVSAAGLAGTDFFGHAYPLGVFVGPSGIIQAGSLSPGTKLDGSGNIIVFSSHGAVILEAAPAKDGLFLYADTGSATQGALIATVAGTSGTDPVNGTKYINGVTAYVVIGGVTYNVSLNQTTSIVSGAGLAINDDNSPAFAAGGVFGEVSGGTPKQAFVTLASGQSSNTDPFASLQTLSQVQSGVSGGMLQSNGGLHVINAALELNGPAIAKAQMQSANAVQLFPDAVSVTPARYSDGGNGDGNTYALGQLTQSLHGTQLINSTTPVVITNMSFNVAVGTRYRLDMMLTWTGAGTTGSAVFGFDGSSTTTQQAVFFWTQGPTSGTGTGGNITSPTLATTRQGLTYTALVVCSVAGVLNVRAQISSGGSNFTINDSYVTLTPL